MTCKASSCSPLKVPSKLFLPVSLDHGAVLLKARANLKNILVIISKSFHLKNILVIISKSLLEVIN